MLVGRNPTRRTVRISAARPSDGSVIYFFSLIVLLFRDANNVVVSTRVVSMSVIGSDGYETNEYVIPT